MSDSSHQNRPLSEISHLFLSKVRDLPKPGAPRPVRIPPGAPRMESAPMPITHSRGDESIDLTPEEFAEVFGKIDLDGDDDKPRKQPIITAVLASHLAGNQADRVKDYARHYAASNGFRVGLIEVDASEFRLMAFEPGVESHVTDDGGEGESFDPRHMAETMEELNVDVDRWLLHVVNPRLPEARTLLRTAGHWMLLSTCDHDGVVSCYRTLKGLSDLHRPRLSLALLEAPSETEATLIHRKLASVCQQFLNWPLVQQSSIEPADNIAEHVVLNCRPLRDKAQLAAAPQWKIVEEFLTTARPEPVEPMDFDTDTLATESSAESDALAADDATTDLEEEMPHIKATPMPVAETAAPPREESPMPTSPFPSLMNEPSPFASPMKLASDDVATDVVDLPSADAAPAAILSAVIRHTPGKMIECPIRPPMCDAATLAVDREKGLVLLAVAKAGLADFRSIAQAFQWLNQNRGLVAMACPQFRIDPLRQPMLELLVDHRDMTADLLQPMLEAGHVTVQAYRKLRWGAKAGLLLEAA